jgi:hypothetical protein
MIWNTGFGAPLPLKDGRRLATLGDAADLIIALPESRRFQTHWQQVAEALLEAASAKSVSAGEVRWQLAIALRAEGLA